MQEIIVFKNQEQASDWLSLVFSAMIAKHNAQQKRTVLGFATGVSPLIMYEKLIAIHQGKYQIDQTTFTKLLKVTEQLFDIDLKILLKNHDIQKHELPIESLSWKEVVTFNLDEFIGLNKDHKEEFANYMNRYLFKDLDLNRKNIHFPNVYTNDKVKAAQDYETAIKNFNGIDLQLVSLGMNGHMAYNEPGTPLDTYTHVATLSDETRDNLVAQKKFSDLKTTPTHAMTVGVKTILEMKQVIMIAFGTSKAQMTRRMLQEEVSSEVTSSALQKHKNCVFIFDQAAASKLNKDDKKYHITFID